MNNRERKLMERVYEIVNRMTGLGPTNPADVKRKCEDFDKMRWVMGKLLMVLSNINFHDFEDAAETLTQIEDYLK